MHTKGVSMYVDVYFYAAFSCMCFWDFFFPPWDCTGEERLPGEQIESRAAQP